MPNLVDVKVTKNKLKFIPDASTDSSAVSDNGDNEFDVIVVNRSDKFASFQLELLAPGLDPNSSVKWYIVKPEICAKKPPGEQTKFHVVITKAPIPAYETTIDITLRVFSVEFADLFNSQKLSLTIEKPRKSLRIYLPNKYLKVYPGDAIEIPVLLYNLSPKYTEVTLNFLELEPEWLIHGNEQQVPIDPGESEKTSFWCQTPKDPKILSQKYSFTVEAKSSTSNYSTREQGIVEVLPQGIVEFSCTPKRQTIPTKRERSHRKQAHIATYDLNFENNSNLPQRVNIQVSEQDQKKCGLVLPDGIDIAPGETKQMYLIAKKPRPWWGWKQIFLFEVTPVLSAPDSGELSTQIRHHPSNKTLELQILPVIPLWLQAIGMLIILLMLWLLWLLNPQGHHTGPVNSVRLIGNGGTVVSGSSDQTIRRWQVDNNPWQVGIRRLKYEGIIARTEKAVRVIRQSPRDDDVIAVGLENGDISLWSILLKRLANKIYQGNDRVFDLAFTRDAQYLFSGHGSGFIRQWDLQNNTEKPKNMVPVGFAISALTVSESQTRANFIVVAGQYDKLALWDWENNDGVNYVQYKLQENQKFQPIIGQHHYIDSLATAGNLLATADNQGYITLWDINTLQCPAKNPAQTAIQGKNKPANTPDNHLECQISILDQWRDGHSQQPVRSVALTQDGCYLASVGDDGRVMLWFLSQGKRSPKAGKALDQFLGVKLNSVDIKASGKDVLVTSDAEPYRVRLYRDQRSNDHASCQ